MKYLICLLLSLTCALAGPSVITVTPASDIQQALNSVEPGSVINLAPGVYDTDVFYVPRARCKLQGAGMGRTIIRKHGRYAAIQNFQQINNDGIEITDLSIDCTKESFMGICLFGSNNIVRRVHIYNHVSPVYPGDNARQESFAILLTSANTPDGKNAPSSGNLIEDCLVSDFAGNYDGGLVIAGQGGVLGTIRNCRIKGGPKPDDPFDFTGVIGAAIVENCLLEDVAIGVYTEGLGPDSWMIVRNCIFRGIRGAALRVNLYQPQGLLIFDSNFVQTTGTGVETAVNTDKIQQLKIRNNDFHGTGQWCSLKQVPDLEVSGNRFDPKMTALVDGCGGYVQGNASHNGEVQLNDGRLKKVKPGRNQLKPIKQAGLN